MTAYDFESIQPLVKMLYLYSLNLLKRFGCIMCKSLMYGLERIELYSYLPKNYVFLTGRQRDAGSLWSNL